MPRVKKVTAAMSKLDDTKRGKRKADDSAKSSPIKKIASDTASTSKEAEQEKVVRFTGLIPVDEQCPLDSKTHHVLVEGNTIYNIMLNQTNIGANNNKYYILQVIKHKTKQEYFSWFRWGRVGKVAGKTLLPGNKISTIEKFSSKFQEKTGTCWTLHSVFRCPFTRKSGKYDLVNIDYGQEECKNEEEAVKSKKAKTEIKSELDPRVQDVVSLIFDVNEWERSVKEMKFDIKKAPLGKLTKQQITAGYKALKKIEKCIQKKQAESALVQACSEFYTKVPHNFGMNRPPLIKTTEDLKEKLQLLEALGDIQIAISILDQDKDDNLNEIDSHYKSLGCGLHPLERKDKEFKNIKKYVQNTHGGTHRQYTLQIEEVFRVDRTSDNKKFKREIGTRMLLWHGSRLTNWCSILKQGLRIAPPEAPVTGYMFGKGVYFADMVSKSANYCCPSDKQPIGLLLVCEVALGNMNEKTRADYSADKLPKGKHSTKGIGKSTPDPKQNVTLPDGAIIPLGRPKNVTNRDAHLMYNEYIVYDTAQVKPRYLVKARFQW